MKSQRKINILGLCIALRVALVSRPCRGRVAAVSPLWLAASVASCVASDGASWSLQQRPGAPRLYQNVPESTRQTLPDCTKVCTRIHQIALVSGVTGILPDCTRVYRITPNCTRLYQIAPDWCPERPRLYQSVPDTRLYQIVPECTRMY